MDLLVEFLRGLGLTGAGSDPLLAYLWASVQEEIRNKTNQDAVPEGLLWTAALRAAGRYLALLQGAGKLEDLGLTVEGVVKQLQEGDTSITYAVGDGDQTPEQRFSALVSWLSGYGADQFNRYRKLVW